MLLAAAIVFAIAALAAAGYAWQQAHRSRRDLHAAHARLARIDAAPPVTHDDEGSVGAEALRRDVRVSFEAREVEHSVAAIERQERDIRMEKYY